MIRALVATATFFALIYFVLFAPDWLRKSVERGFDILSCWVYETITFLNRLLNIATLVLHFLGKVATLILLAGSLTVFFNETASALGFGAWLFGATYDACLELFKKPYTWAAATTIVATTVAIGNLRKFDIDFVEFVEKQRERSEKRYREKRERDNKGLSSPLYRRNISRDLNLSE